MQKTASAIRVHSAAIIAWVFLVASSLPVLTFAYLGTFTRYLADDYSTAGIVLSLGLWKAQIYWYVAWMGAFSYTFLVSLVELAGVRIVPWLPLTSLLLWSGFLYWALRQFFRTLELPIGKIWTAILANIIIFGTLKSFRDYSQLVFWQTGIFAYEISMLLVALMVGIFLKRFMLSKNRPMALWEYWVWFLAFFFVAGISEIWSVLQISLTGMIFFAFALVKNFPMRKEILRVSLIGFFSSWAALFVILMAPGNKNHFSAMDNLSFGLILNSFLPTFWDVPRYLWEWMDGNTLLVLLLLLTGLAAGLFNGQTGKPKNILWLGLGLLLGSIILLWADFVPYYTIMGIRSIDRVLILAMFLFIWALVLVGVFAGITFGSRLSPGMVVNTQAALAVFLCVLMVRQPVQTAFMRLSVAPSLRLYAQLWDERDLYLRQCSTRGEKDVVVDSLRYNPALIQIQNMFWIQGDLEDAASSWINKAASHYYGLNSIRLRRLK